MNVIQPDQRGFLPNRNMAGNIHLLCDLVDYSSHNVISGTVFGLYIYNAFDSVEWPFLLRLLKHLGFKSSVIEAIQLLYSDSCSCVANHNHISENFKLGKGLKQGDPISPYLFILCVDVLGDMIRQNNGIRGICVEDKEYKLAMAADDTLIFSDGNKRGIEELLEVLKKFGELSGCKTNIAKSQAMSIGPLTGDMAGNRMGFHFKWDTSIQILGVVITNDMKGVFERNFPGVLEKMKAVLQIWRMRGLSLLGKVCIIKSRVVSILTYYVSSLPVHKPDRYIKAINSTLYGFLWGSKWERVKRKTLVGPKQLGGIDMTDIKSFIISQKLKWLKYMLDDEYSSNWKCIETTFLAGHNLNCLLEGSLN